MSDVSPGELLQVFESWLKARQAVVVVGGSKSRQLVLENMVFQGTVWGPMLWNIFYADAATAIRSTDFTEIVFADDLNAFKKYASKKSTDHI